MNTITEEMTLWYEMHRLQERYVGTIDADASRNGQICSPRTASTRSSPRKTLIRAYRSVSCTASVAPCCLTESFHSAKRMYSSPTLTAI